MKCPIFHNHFSLEFSVCVSALGDPSSWSAIAIAINEWSHLKASLTLCSNGGKTASFMMMRFLWKRHDLTAKIGESIPVQSKLRKIYNRFLALDWKNPQRVENLENIPFDQPILKRLVIYQVDRILYNLTRWQKTIFDKTWKNLTRFDHTWQNLTWFDKIWQDLAWLNKTWQNLTWFDKSWQGLAKLYKTWQNLTKLDKL